MIQYEIDLPAEYTSEQIHLLLKQQVERHRFGLSGPTHPRTRPGSSHWHGSGSEGSGTVEFTHDPAVSALIVSVRSNRCGTWAGEAVATIATALARAFRAE